MSMLYKSLQKLRREEEAEGPRPSFPSGYGPQWERKRFLRAGAIAVGIVGVSVLLAWLIRAQLVSYLELLETPSRTEASAEARHTVRKPAERRVKTASPAKQRKEGAQVATAEETGSGSSAGQNASPESSPTAPVQEKRGAEKTQARESEPQETPSKSTHANAQSSNPGAAVGSASPPGQQASSLEQHFSKQAERNRRIQSISNGLQEALRRSDAAMLRSHLANLREILPPESPLVLKWEGVLALHTQAPDKAVQYFQRVLEKTPKDHVARVNLAVALIRVGKKHQARSLVDDLYQQRPDAPLVRRLARQLQIVE